MGVITRETIRDMIRDRADIVGDTVRHTNADLNQHISDSLTRLQGILATKGLLRDEAVKTITADGSTSYALDSDFLSIVKVFREDGTEMYSPLQQFDAARLPTQQAGINSDATSYRMFTEAGTKRISFYPEPTSGTYYIVYVPLLSLSQDGDALDAALVWHEYIISDVARLVYRKDNLDPTGFIQDRELALRQIVDMTEAQDLSQTYVIKRVRDYSIEDAADYKWPRSPYSWW